MKLQPDRRRSARPTVTASWPEVKRSLIVALAGSLVLLAGCSASGPSMEAPAMDSSFTAPGIAVAPESGGADRAQAPTTVERKEVVTGQVFVTAADPIQAARDAIDAVESVGGRVDNRTENPGTDNSTASSSIVARIPADELSGTLDRISDLGKVTNVSITRDDVTMEYQDLDARIAALTSSVERLKALIAGASNTADLIEAESALASRQGELDSLTSQQKYLADQVELSTVTVQFSTDDITPPAGPDSFWDGLVAGWHSLVAAGRGALVAFGRAIPWLGAVTIGAAVVYAVVRIIRRASTDTAPRAADLDESSASETETD